VSPHGAVGRSPNSRKGPGRHHVAQTLALRLRQVAFRFHRRRAIPNENADCGGRDRALTHDVGDVAHETLWSVTAQGGHAARANYDNEQPCGVAGDEDQGDDDSDRQSEEHDADHGDMLPEGDGGWKQARYSAAWAAP